MGGVDKTAKRAASVTRAGDPRAVRPLYRSQPMARAPGSTCPHSPFAQGSVPGAGVSFGAQTAGGVDSRGGIEHVPYRPLIADPGPHCDGRRGRVAWEDPWSEKVNFHGNISHGNNNDYQLKGLWAVFERFCPDRQYSRNAWADILPSHTPASPALDAPATRPHVGRQLCVSCRPASRISRVADACRPLRRLSD
jgi:hypothetical protein